MDIEVAIPCYNEELTVAKVVCDFQKALPGATFIVYDNNSTDHTAERAREAGAKVVPVLTQGKGVVVRTVFETTKAAVVVLVDGDDTYEGEDVNKLVAPVVDGKADMVIGTRLHNNPEEFRAMHHFGNRLLTGTLNSLYGTKHVDILSGYRAFSRRFIEHLPLTSTGFDIETELLIQAHEQNFSVLEVPIRFRDRPPGSFSKLNSFRDGYRILLTMITLLRDHRPLMTFTVLAAATFVVGAVGWFIGYNRAEQVLLRHAGVVVMMAAFGLQLVGLVLNTINVRVRELMSLQRREKL